MKIVLALIIAPTNELLMEMSWRYVNICNKNCACHYFVEGKSNLCKLNELLGLDLTYVSLGEKVDRKLDLWQWLFEDA